MLPPRTDKPRDRTVKGLRLGDDTGGAVSSSRLDEESPEEDCLAEDSGEEGTGREVSAEGITSC
eukprot:m.105375 g.105375  ORF g.105375 m.105375 type:complete len:64 (+) comp15111_c1_seq1:162-353(+)